MPRTHHPPWRPLQAQTPTTFTRKRKAPGADVAAAPAAVPLSGSAGGWVASRRRVALGEPVSEPGAQEGEEAEGAPGQEGEFMEGEEEQGELEAEEGEEEEEEEQAEQAAQEEQAAPATGALGTVLGALRSVLGRATQQVRLRPSTLSRYA